MAVAGDVAVQLGKCTPQTDALHRGRRAHLILHPFRYRMSTNYFISYAYTLGKPPLEQYFDSRPPFSTRRAAKEPGHSVVVERERMGEVFSFNHGDEEDEL